MNAQEHLLTCLAEECAEVAQVCSKALRFGLDDRNVLDPTGPTNRERLITEINDLAAVVILLQEHNILPVQWYNYEKQIAKKAKVKKFMDYAEKSGALTPNFSPNKLTQTKG